MNKSILFFLFSIFVLNSSFLNCSLPELISEYKKEQFIKLSDHEKDIVFGNDLNLYSHFLQQKMSMGRWVGDIYPKDSWFKVSEWKPMDILDDSIMFLNNPRFFPYIEKFILNDPNSQIAFIGDIHDNLDNLIDYLDVMKGLGYLDAKYNICKYNFYVVFLGDYIDRSEKYKDKQVLNFLVKFYNQNPGSIFMLRGNHDEPNIEVPQEQLARDSLKYNFFETLPVALFVGVKEDEHKINFVQCCHGGIEPGFVLKPFLTTDGVSFQKILRIERSKLDTDKMLNIDAENHFDLDCSLFRDFNVVANLSLIFIALGFVWSDFWVDVLRQGLDIAPDRDVFIYGEAATRSYLQNSSSPTRQLVKIVRGHQHAGQMMLPLLRNDMCVPLWDKLVYTLISHVDKNKSFMIWHTAPNPEDWKFVHYYTEYGVENKWMCEDV